ncbi:predicted protein [Verticillium alfalfae VaMs.102]|uniref:Predicted protein n=1 Tax=Verticillium alfalfae (strain VaMs.102 / ATCC MYA-4576 / FGSC 10136) TaxID=526221 RepID=C9SJA2_VERA1|nr:predicted protein [Verticillium alfalfae VaMs.102]EEY18264.1 predicted protein [Verticillium alfalfae VaMs.102]
MTDDTPPSSPRGGSVKLWVQRSTTTSHAAVSLGNASAKRPRTYFLSQEEPSDGSPPVKKKRNTRETQSTKSYPQDIARLTRFGKGTFAIGHGPLPDDIDWTQIPVPKSWEAPAEAELGLTHEAAIEVGGGIAAQQRPGGFRKGANEKTHESTKKALTQRMILVKRQDAIEWDDWGSYDPANTNSADFYIRGSDKTYCITINNSPKCDCPAKNTTPKTTASTSYFSDVLVHILRAPEALIYQKTLIDDEIRALLTQGPNLRPTLDQINNDSTMKDGIAKDIIAQDCPICYQSLGDEAPVTCVTCGRHAHESCHKKWEHENSGWGPLKCLTCQDSCSNSWELSGIMSGYLFVER